MSEDERKERERARARFDELGRDAVWTGLLVGAFPTHWGIHAHEWLGEQREGAPR